MRCLQFSLLAAVAVIGFASITHAADLPIKVQPQFPPPTPTYSWTGFYVGANAGYGLKEDQATFTPNDPASQAITCTGPNGGTCPPPASFNIQGAVGGLQAGYNWQFNQNWLLGLETDFDWSGMQGSGSSSFILGDALTTYFSSFQAGESVKWFGTVRGRFGFLPANNILLYGTGGFAYGRVDENVALNTSPVGNNLSFGGFSFNCAGIPNCFLGSSSRIAAGWTLGGGIELLLWQNVSLKAEYLYVDLGGHSVNVVAQSAPFVGTAPSSFTAAYSAVGFNVLRAGLNWKF
jgi:outer membrane immunogenic protein